jgi:NAD-dependent histone deacetylase SIR2
MGNEQSREDVGDDVEPQTLKARNLEAVAELIRNGDVVNIVCMTGAGISTRYVWVSSCVRG